MISLLDVATLGVSRWVCPGVLSRAPPPGFQMAFMGRRGSPLPQKGFVDVPDSSCSDAQKEGLSLLSEAGLPDPRSLAQDQPIPRMTDNRSDPSFEVYPLGLRRAPLPSGP